MNAEWFESTADELTRVLAAVMQIKPSYADRIVNATVAKLGVVGTTAGVYGVAALFGTASTGTAIGTLSGAAANSATLAWLGGSVFTGTIVLVGIASVGAWASMRLWKGKPREYESLETVEKNIVNACANLAKAFREQAKLEAPPDVKTMKVVLDEGLLPLCVALDNYLSADSSKQWLTANLSPGARVRLRFRTGRIRSRVAEATQEMGHVV